MAKRKKKKRVAKTAVSTPETAVEAATPMTKQQKNGRKIQSRICICRQRFTHDFYFGRNHVYIVDCA